jgi:DNA-binding transcriptional LysR family regulator
VLAGLQHASSPVYLAASHTATESLLDEALVELGEAGPPVELVSCNSSVVRRLVADGRADIGIAANEPNGDTDDNLSELPLGTDEIVVAVPLSHPWARRRRITVEEFLSTPMVVRDPAANSRETVEATLRARGLTAAKPLAEIGTTLAVKNEARRRGAPALLSRSALVQHTIWKRSRSKASRSSGGSRSCCPHTTSPMPACAPSATTCSRTYPGDPGQPVSRGA